MTLRKTLAALGGILTLSALLGTAAPARAVELVGLNLSGAGFASQVLPERGTPVTRIGRISPPRRAASLSVVSSASATDGPTTNGPALAPPNGG